jgi:hypothetical protein
MTCLPVAPPVPLYGLDIETDTTLDGLDPEVGRVLAVAVAGDAGVEVLADADEAQLLGRLDARLRGLPRGVVVTWNGSGFDLPYLARRADRLGVPLGLELRVDPARRSHHPPLPGHAAAYRARWHHHAHLDVYRSYRADVGPGLRMGCSLKAVAGLAGLAPIEVDVAHVHTLTVDDLTAYVASDAACTRELARRRWPTVRAAVDRVGDAVPDPATAWPATRPS